MLPLAAHARVFSIGFQLAELQQVLCRSSLERMRVADRGYVVAWLTRRCNAATERVVSGLMRSSKCSSRHESSLFEMREQRGW